MKCLATFALPCAVACMVLAIFAGVVGCTDSSGHQQSSNNTAGKTSEENRSFEVVVSQKTGATSNDPTVRTKGFTLQTEEPTVPKRWALLIGVNEYANPQFRQLTCTDYDMLELRKTLIEHSGYDANCVRLILDGNAEYPTPSKKNILKELKWLTAQAAAGDTILVAFSGHGMAEKNGGAYWIPFDGDPHHLAKTALSINTVNRLLENSLATDKIVIVDACHSAAQSQSKGSGLADVRLNLMENFGVDSKGFWGLFSCQGDQESYIDLKLGKNGHSLFIYYLIEALKGHADDNKNNEVDLSEVNEYLARNVKKHAHEKLNHSQIPVFKSYGSSFPVLSKYDRTHLALKKEGAAFITMPGIAGHWWFDERPWLLPEVRLQLAMSLRDAPKQRLQLQQLAAQSSASQFYDQLRMIIRQFAKKERDNNDRNWPEITRKRFYALNYDPQADAKEKILQEFTKVVKELIGKENDELTGTDLHLLAVYYHSHSDFEKAEKSYHQAIAAYTHKKQWHLEFLCRSDLAHLCIRQREWNDAASIFAQLADDFPESSHESSGLLGKIFMTHCQGWLCRARRSEGSWEKARQSLVEALSMSQQLPKDHPTRAFINEQMGRYHLGRWWVDIARKNFDEAVRIRQKDERAAGQSVVLWDRQLIAMLMFYDNKINEAAVQYRALLNDIHKSKDMTDAQQKEALARTPNLNERLFDCLMFSTPTGQHLDKNPLLKTIAYAERKKNFVNRGLGAILVRLYYKACAVHAMDGDLKTALQFEEKAKKIIAGALAPLIKTKGDSVTKKYDRTRKVAAACLQWQRALVAGKRDDAALAKLFQIPPEDWGSLWNSREDLLMLCFVAKRFFADPKTDANALKIVKEQLPDLLDITSKGKPVVTGTRSTPKFFATLKKLGENFEPRRHQDTKEKN